MKDRKAMKDRKPARTAGAALAIALILSLPARPASCEPFARLQADWEAGKYAAVLPQLIRYWNGAAGRTWQVAYMIGTSWCQVGLRAQGATTLEDVLETYALPAEVREVVTTEIGRCREPGPTTARPRAPAAADRSVMVISAAAGVTGKGGFLFWDQGSQISADLQSAPIPAYDLRRRLVPVSAAAQAAVEGKKRLQDDAGTAVVGPFAVVAARADNGLAEDTGRCLQRYRAALAARFGMELAPYAVTVYAMPSLEQVELYAQRLHGRSLAPGTLAYSIYDDLSMVGPGGYGQCGTLAHELVHLMIRAHFGNSPAWLEEGIASEVAVAAVDAGKLRFAPSWRDDMLVREWAVRPTVAELLTENWTAYQASSREALARVAAVQSMAAVFIRYLADRGTLDNVYSACRDRHLDPELARGPRPYAQIVADRLHMSPAAIEADFVGWFRASTPHAATLPASGGRSGDESSTLDENVRSVSPPMVSSDGPRSSGHDNVGPAGVANPAATLTNPPPAGNAPAPSNGSATSFTLRAAARELADQSADGSKRYAFSLWLEAPPAVRERVREVAYHLRYDKNPLDLVGREGATSFRAEYNGWGCYQDVAVEVTYRDGRSEQRRFDMCETLGW